MLALCFGLPPGQERIRTELRTWLEIDRPGVAGGGCRQRRALRLRGARSRSYWPSARVANSNVSISTRKRRSEPDDESLISNVAVALGRIVPVT